MFFSKSTSDYSKNIVSINSIYALEQHTVNKYVKLMLIFSLEKCKPCDQLASIIDDLFQNTELQNQSLPLQVIKFDYNKLHASEQHFLEVFPTTIVLTPNQLNNIKDDESLLEYGLKNGTVYKGQIQKLCDDHNLITF